MVVVVLDVYRDGHCLNNYAEGCVSFSVRTS